RGSVRPGRLHLYVVWDRQRGRGAVGAVGIVAMQHLQVLGVVVVVRHHGVPVAVQNQGRVAAYVDPQVGNGDRLVAAGAVGVVAMQDLELLVVIVVVGDHRVAVSVQRQRGVHTHVPFCVRPRDRVVGETFGVGTMKDLQVLIVVVVVGDHRVAIGVEGQRGGVTDIPIRVHPRDGCILTIG